MRKTPKIILDIENFLDSRLNFEKERPSVADEMFTLDRISALLTLLGDPHLAVPCIHIAGTKGKGSTAFFLESAFIAAGFRPGVYTSPHLEHLFERIRINGKRPQAAALRSAFAHLRRAVDELDVADEPPTYFEILTALAFLVFAREGVDVMIVETGLGGSFDATNVVSPMAAIITNIGMEHTYFLGDTIKEIATAKAGIIKPGVPVVTAASGDALRVIRTRARKMRSAVRVLGRDFRMVRTRGGGGELVFRSPALNLDRIRLGAIGRHQAANAACALMALSLVGKKFKGLLGKRTLREALLSTRPEARVELVRRDPMVIIDSAHTTASAAALADALEDLDPRPEGTRVLVFAAMADKDVKGILKLLVGSFDAFVFTRAPSPRAAAPGKLAGIFRKISRKPAWSAGKPEAARRRALKLAGRDGLVTVAGSFYLAGMLRGAW